MTLSSPNATSVTVRAAMAEALASLDRHPAADQSFQAKRPPDQRLPLGISAYQLIESLPSRIS